MSSPALAEADSSSTLPPAPSEASTNGVFKFPFKKGVDVRPMLQNFITSDDPLNLDNIRHTLIRLEDTIIFGEFIKRGTLSISNSCSLLWAPINTVVWFTGPTAYYSTVVSLSRDTIYSFNWPDETATYKGLIERAQFALNPKMYEHGGFKELSDQGFDGTWLEWFLKETETFHGM